jgi:hypothetical protein
VADCSREDVPAVRAGRQLEAEVERADLGERTQEAILIVVVHHRSADRHEEAAGVRHRVAPEPVHAEAPLGVLELLRDDLEPGDDIVHTAAVDLLVQVPHPDEAHCEGTMLSLGLPTGEGTAEVERDAALRAGSVPQPHGPSRDVRQPVDPRRGPAIPTQEGAARVTRSDPARNQRGRGGLVEEHLAGLGGLLEQTGGGRSCPDGEEHLLLDPEPSEPERPAVESDRHAEPHGSTRGRDGRNPFERPLHLERDGRRAVGVRRTVEQHEERVPAELQHVAAPGEHGLDDPGEDVVDDPCDRLPTDPPAAGEALGEPREPRHVGEQQGAVESEVPAIPGDLRPGEREGRGVRDALHPASPPPRSDHLGA